MPNTFIKAAEVWLPSADGSLLEFHAGAFGSARRMAAVSRNMCFGRGEGLPGLAWDEGKPVLLPNFESRIFRRTAAAHAGGLDCAIAMPTFKDGKVQAVLVLFCGHDPAQPGALELWRYDASVAVDMVLAVGAYGSTGASFESISQDTYLPRGTGLPGMAWKRGEAVFMEELAAAQGGFLRAEQAVKDGLQRGLAIPVDSTTENCHVVTFLAGPQLPLAQRIERWVPDASRSRLTRTYAFSELHGGRSQVEAELPLTPPAGGMPGSIVAAWKGGVPEINEYPASEPGAPAAAASSIGATALLAIPIWWGGEVVEVLALYL
jgi:hypothetical protein